MPQCWKHHCFHHNHWLEVIPGPLKWHENKQGCAREMKQKSIFRSYLQFFSVLAASGLGLGFDAQQNGSNLTIFKDKALENMKKV